LKFLRREFQFQLQSLFRPSLVCYLGVGIVTKGISLESVNFFCVCPTSVPTLGHQCNLN
jgi:hypothetical protein